MDEVAVIHGEDEFCDFFAPTSSDLIDQLLGEYRLWRQRISQIAAMASGEIGQAVHYFIAGAGDSFSRRAPVRSFLAEETSAIKALNSAYWSKTMELTDIYNAMPQARRDEWNKSIQEMTAPEFTEEAVRPTIEGLLASRQTFFAERVDGIFRSLSGEHVTNSPMGFGKRMIIAHLLSSYGSTNHDRVGHINDLRCVIAKFMGRDEPRWNATSSVVDRARRERRGEWVTLDGGALRLRAYLCGTAHLEVHPDMAWRLNQVLHHLYPSAIPSEFRSKPKKKAKTFQMMGRPLPFAVVELLGELEKAYRLVKVSGDWRREYHREFIPNTLQFNVGSHAWGQAGKPARDEAERVLVMIGGVKAKEGWYQFDYAPSGAIGDIICSGCIPDQKAYQFYPTPENLTAKAVELAQIGPNDSCLEPSAGHGPIAMQMDPERTTCVEISSLHCEILRARGWPAIQADFIEWAKTAPTFDVIVMNPPFSEGRAKYHTETAASLLKPGGRLVAILPASMRNNYTLHGLACTWSDVYSNEFAGTSVSVAILKAMKP